ncbi:hypothetical protein ACVGOW_25150 [Pseudonocardia saturnea]
MRDQVVRLVGVLRDLAPSAHPPVRHVGAHDAVLWLDDLRGHAGPPRLEDGGADASTAGGPTAGIPTAEAPTAGGLVGDPSITGAVPGPSVPWSG